MRGEVVEDLLAHRQQALDAHERWPKTLDVEAGQSLWLVQLDVHGKEIDLLNAFCHEQVVQRNRWNFSDFVERAELLNELLVAGRHQ